MDVDELTKLLRDAHPRALVDRLARLTPQERKALGPKVRGWITRGHSLRADADAIALAGLGTADGERQAATVIANSWDTSDDFVGKAVDLLARRKPAWLERLPEALVGEQGAREWAFIHALVVAGLGPEPDDPRYFVGTVHGVRTDWGPNAPSVLDALRASPDLVGDHIFTVLATEQAGRRLASHDSWLERTDDYTRGPKRAPRPEDTWRHALVVLTQAGQLDRGRLLDAALAAPLRDWAAADLGWYVGLHNALEPTLDEVAARQSTYTRLLAVEHGPSVKLAQTQLKRLLADPRLEPEPLLTSSRATLSRSDKASVTAQLRVLTALAKVRPDLDVGGSARVALDHPRAEVREQAAKLLDKLGVTDERASVALPPGFMAPEHEPRPTPERVIPVADEDELGDLLLRLVEDADDPVEIERAIDGLLRFADRLPIAADVLLRRSTEAEWYVDDPRLILATLTQAWLLPRPRFRRELWVINLAHANFGQRPAHEHSLYGVAGRRLSDIALAIRRGPSQGLALPTFADGTIEPADLVERLESIGRKKASTPPAYEAALAVLRVAPERLPELTTHGAGPTRYVVAEAIRRIRDHAPRWERETRDLPTRWEWEAPTRLTVFRDHSSLPGADAPVDALFARADPWQHASVELEFGEYQPGFEPTIAFCALMLPHHPDVFAAHVHPQLVRDLAKDRGVSAAVLDALALTPTRLDRPGSSALVLGLAAKDARIRTAAQDALVDLSRWGRLDGTLLGSEAAAHLRDDLIVGKRFSDGLTEVSAAADTAVLPVLSALEALLPALAGRRDAGAFLELTADLAERTGRSVHLPAEFLALASGRSASMAAMAVRRLAR